MRPGKELRDVMFACLIGAAGSCGHPPAGAIEPAADTTLKDLQNLDELRALFNKDKDTPRLILLLSPT